MKIEGPLLPGRFVERPNRFLMRIDLGGTIVDSHLPDPGRLQELLVTGVTVYVRPVPQEATRKTRYSTVMVEKDGVLVSVVSALPNRFVAEELAVHGLPMLAGYQLQRAEVALGRHRFDFLLGDPQGKPFYLEVKSVTFVENGTAQFPDAVTERGARHARHLAELAQAGTGAGILFVCQRPDAEKFRPMYERDPDFAAALVEAQNAGVQIWCITTRVSLEEMTYYQEIPVSLPGK